MLRLIFLATLSLLTALSAAVEFVVVDGGNFITNSTGKRFSIIGVDYQPGGSSGLTTTADPLSDSDTCLRDAIMLQQMGINTIRVYNLDANLDHSACVSIFNAAGIYMIIDVNSGMTGQFIDRTDPSGTYTTAYLEHVFGIIENFAPYPNTLGFFAANEILNQQSVADVPQYIRAVVRDMKTYIANNIGRQIGVGYSAADLNDEFMGDSFNYLDCNLANSTESKIDFFGLNDYEWCGHSSFTVAGYNNLTTLFGSTDIPVFFSEYGCITVQPRDFTNVPVLYGDQMSVLSGGLAYQYSQETNGYGLVAINSTNEITILADYNYLKEELAAIDIASLQSVNASATARTAATCAPSLIANASFANSWDLPTPPSGAAAIITSGVSSGFVKGSLVAISTTTMPATILNVTGAAVTGLKLVELMCSDANYPGLINDYTSTSVSCDYATATGGVSPSSTKKAAAGRVAVGTGWLVVASLTGVLAWL